MGSWITRGILIALTAISSGVFISSFIVNDWVGKNETSFYDQRYIDYAREITDFGAVSIGCLLASPSGHMLDLVAAGLIGLRPEQVPTLAAAIRRGLVPAAASALTLSGDPAAFAVPDFKTVPAQASVAFLIFGSGKLGRMADAVGKRILTPFPKLEADACIGCGKCAATCPAKAIAMKNKKPRIDRSKCIHCFCCQEFCPKGAMTASRHWLPRLLGK